jgi:hypothetical protein
MLISISVFFLITILTKSRLVDSEETTSPPYFATVYFVAYVGPQSAFISTVFVQKGEFDLALYCKWRPITRKSASCEKACKAGAL